MYRISMPELPIHTPRVLFDISRLVRSRTKSFGTGVDRIDLAIGLDLLRRFDTRCHFICAAGRGFSLLPWSLGKNLLLGLDGAWNGSQLKPLTREADDPFRWLLQRSVGRLFFQPRNEVISTETTYVVASHSGIGKIRGGMNRLDPRQKMRRVVYIHDLIPLDYPEYQRPETFRQFTDYLTELADAPVFIIANSEDTEKRVKSYAKLHNWSLMGTEIAIPRLRLHSASSAPLSESLSLFLHDPSPYFVILGTIEPRKNHMLLLQIWRELSQLQAAPRLCIVGKRGWENENVFDMLERCLPLKGCVFEFSGLTDFEVQTLLQDAKALLFPSFAEGLGIPVLEAAALNVPCILSDIPVFREIAPPGTVFLSPLDGIGWKREILALADDIGERRYVS
ncbi:glycosyltransferase family 1 protein [Rhizobium sp. BK376]|uniref:glycosyltransferase family 4 protein n=1 Tax=Rhizobium sp. BK376 TaxID=2512149 RepID=UPI00104360AA|nr:glycosyltransferase family 1 protein [Rhizobium sp. BK376]